MIHIKSGVLLAIFSLFLIHQVIPHQHHEHHSHDGMVQNYVEVEHGHDHHHEHEHEEKESSESLFLDFFLACHSHTNNGVNAEYTHTNTVVNKQKTLNVYVVAANESFAGLELQPFNVNPNLLFYSPPDILYNSYIVRPELRGPPALG